jgi:hypothetical protein
MRAGSIAEQGKRIVEPMAEGDITPEEAATAMQVIGSQAKIIEVDELRRRLEALEARVGLGVKQ